MSSTLEPVRTDSTTLGLYREIRGSGPAVVMIAGATGDAGHFARTADRLADEFTVITYDRRGNSRSRSDRDPASVAAIASQADDVAALVRASGLDHAVVFGTSGGGIITLELLARHPDVVRGAIVHEPPLLTLLPPSDGPNPLQPVFELAARDKRAALAMFVRINTTDAAWEQIDSATRERMLANASILLDFELPAFMSYQLDHAALVACPVPVIPMYGATGLPFSPAVQTILEQRFGWSGTTISGHHGAYFDTPEVLAEELRPILGQLISAA